VQIKKPVFRDCSKVTEKADFEGRLHQKQAVLSRFPVGLLQSLKTSEFADSVKTVIGLSLRTNSGITRRLVYSKRLSRLWREAP
jgi:hypothetical protein